MSPSARLDEAVRRICAAGSAIRARSYDANRLEQNGGSTAEVKDRLEVVISRLERAASDLEQALS
jgi:hypothetical protein